MSFHKVKGWRIIPQPQGNISPISDRVLIRVSRISTGNPETKGKEAREKEKKAKITKARYKTDSPDKIENKAGGRPIPKRIKGAQPIQIRKEGIGSLQM